MECHRRSAVPGRPGFGRGLNSEDLLDARKKNGWEGLSGGGKHSSTARRQERLEQEWKELERTGRARWGRHCRDRRQRLMADRRGRRCRQTNGCLRSTWRNLVETLPSLWDRMYHKRSLVYTLAENVLSVCGTLRYLYSFLTALLLFY